MLHLIEQMLPASLHRSALQIVFRLRHYWRRWRKTPIIGCNVVITDLKGEIIMVRHSYGPAVWGLPGGGVGRNEDPAKAARRELKEELGLSPTKLRHVAEVTSEVSGSALTIHVFAVTSDAHPKPDNREVIEARFFPPHSLPEPVSETTRRLLAAWREAERRPH